MDDNAPLEAAALPDLTPKQALFVAEYLQRMNATEAAIAAGYSKRSAGSIGSENLKKPDILAHVRARLDAAAADADEVLRKLTDHARGSMADYMRIDKSGLPVLDFRRAKRLDKLHVIKSFKHTRKTKIVYEADRRTAEIVETESGLRRGVGDVEVVEDTYEVELYDAQAALNLLGKHHRLFDRALEDDWRREFEDAGLDATSEFEQLKERIRARLTKLSEAEPGAGSDDRPGDGGGEARA